MRVECARVRVDCASVRLEPASERTRTEHIFVDPVSAQ